MRRLRTSDHGITQLTGCRAIDLLGAPTEREETAEGYVVAPAFIARTGVQLYRGAELGMKGADASRTFRVLRPETEVFHPEALKSFELKPLANDHPPKDITADNWRKMAADGRVIGDVMNVGPAEGNRVSAKLVFRDKSAIAALNAGKSQLSCGYTFDADFMPGVTEDGQKYDLVQRNIRGNHVALVDVGRAGPGCRVADREPNQQPKRTRAMSEDIELIPVKINGVTVRVAATDAQNAIDAYDRHEKAVKDMKSACDEAQVAHGAAVKERDAYKGALDAALARLDDMEPDGDETDEQGKPAEAKKGKDSAVSLADRIESIVVGVRASAKKAVDAATKRATDAEAKVPTAEKLDAIVAERAAAIDGTKKLVGDSIKPGGKSVHAVRTEAVAHVIANDAALKPIAEAVLGGVALDKAAPELVTAAFNASVAAKAKTPARDAAPRADIGSILARDSAGARGGARTAVVDMTDPMSVLRTRQINGGRIPGQDAGQ